MIGKLWKTALGVAVLGTTFAGTASAAVGIIDTFSDADLSEYTLTKVFDQANGGTGTSNISFATAAGALSVRSTGTTGAEQVLFLRDDVSLGIGEQLLADVPAVSGTAPRFDRDFGIAVGFRDDPAGLGNGVAGDARANFIEVSRRDSDQVNVFAFRQNGGDFTTTTSVFSPNNVPALSLFIARTSATTFEAGFYRNGVRLVTASGSPFTFANPQLGAAVGFYSDLRFSGTAPVTLDNLRISVIPEPASLAAIAAVGGVMTLRRRRSR